MNSKSRYELAASVCRGKVWLDNTALAAISRMYRKRIENATSKLGSDRRTRTLRFIQNRSGARSP